MGGFYRVDFQGYTGRGTSTFALANGKIAGLDASGGIYRGTYVMEDDRIRGTVALTFPGGGELVTGVHMQPGTEVSIPFDIPGSKSTNVHGVSVEVEGRRVDITLTRIADL